MNDANQKLRVHSLAMSLDGYAAGPGQDVDNPMGVGGRTLHDWVFATPAGRKMLGMDPGDAAPGIDDAFIEAGTDGIGATIMGRNMFGPIRGSWDDGSPEPWTGWWGDTPPYHHPVFVLTHYEREPLPMAGGTTFNFVDADIAVVLEQAFEAADGKDVRLGGGASTVQQYLRAGLIDEMHVAVSPVLLGGGERLFDNLDGRAAEGYEVSEVIPSGAVSHVRLTRV